MKRSLELRDRYIMSIEKHLDDLIQDRSDRMLETEDFARLLFVHPIHLANTMKEVTGTSAYRFPVQTYRDK